MGNVAEEADRETGICGVHVCSFGELVASNDTSAETNGDGEWDCGRAIGIENSERTVTGGGRGGYGKGVREEVVVDIGVPRWRGGMVDGG